MFDCGCEIVTEPDVPDQLPMPAIEAVRPVPDGSDSDHVNTTGWLPPAVTVLGLAVNELITGTGQALAVTLVCAEAVAPQPAVALMVYVVVDCG